ncbi:MAG TPA: S41 family peptidase [Anaerolineales bacterium]|nr:S41 family peptidase [Anaerolineales bacterium]
MKSGIWIYLAGGLLVILVLTGIFSLGLFFGGVFAAETRSLVDAAPLTLPDNIPGGSDPTSAIKSPENLEELFKPFWESWKVVHDQYIDQPVDDEVLMRGAIRGMLEALDDPHTSYMNPEEYRQSSIMLAGEYEGIGAWVDPRGEYLAIISPMPGSPAEKAGLLPGDQILAVDGNDMTGINPNLVISRVLGPAGSEVTLTIRRDGQEKPFEVTLKRASIIVPSVESKTLEGDIAYIKLTTFGYDSTEELRNAIQDTLKQKPVGIILDLRNNGGGALDTAIEVASEFVGEGVIMHEEFGNGERKTYNTLNGGLATEIPLVVLINQGSASASEIVAGAIQDHERGALVGVTSFGKGSVQLLNQLANDQGVVRITIARWLTPDGKTIHETGIEPDYVVELTEEDQKAGRDPQLEKAIELLKNQ